MDALTTTVTIEFEDYIQLRLTNAKLQAEVSDHQIRRWNAEGERDKYKARVQELEAELESYKKSNFREIDLIDITKQDGKESD